jgi:membrane-associated phospholipid phosphatase
VNASYPSGHTAASIAVYGGLALLLTSAVTNVAFRTFTWTIALAMVTFVATARLYRGMHHPLDVTGGVVVGVAALFVVVFACRTAGAAAESRRGARAGAQA